MLDGFEVLGDRFQYGLELNLYPLRNLVSPFVDTASLPRSSSSADMIVDTYYGFTYDSWVSDAKAVYGKTKDLPHYAGEELENYGFLRVPFRRVPRRIVKSQAELEFIVNSIVSADPDIKLLLRGQNREYRLSRSKETLIALYGDANAIEPSLLPSSTRRSLDYDIIAAEWFAIIQDFMHEYGAEIAKTLTRRATSEMYEEQAKIKTTYNLALFALALAQHYGLPSVGLDVTTNIDTALFFALSDFSMSPTDNHLHICKPAPTNSEFPVIYLLSEGSRAHLNYDQFRPKWFPTVRPSMQQAHFIHTGWGLSKNDCARNIFLALYLDTSVGKFNTPPVERLFPQRGEDAFGRFLESLLDQPMSVEMGKFLSYFAWVAPDLP